jgi:hypothetical protein
MFDMASARVMPTRSRDAIHTLVTVFRHAALLALRAVPAHAGPSPVSLPSISGSHAVAIGSTRLWRRGRWSRFVT